MTHQDIAYESIAKPSWTDVTEFTQNGSTYLQGTCLRCKGTTTRRTGSIVVQGTKKATKPFVVKCECGHTSHAGRPDKAAYGCGAYWYSEPVEA